VGNPSFWYGRDQSLGCDSSYRQQNATLRSFTSRTSPTTRTFRRHASIAFLTQNKNQVQQYIRRSIFLLSFNHRRTIALPFFRFCERHRLPFFARRPSLSSSVSHGGRRQTRSLTPPPPPRPHPLLLTTPQPQHLRRLPWLPVNSLHLCVASAPFLVRARCGECALLRVAPCLTAKP